MLTPAFDTFQGKRAMSNIPYLSRAADSRGLRSIQVLLSSK